MIQMIESGDAPIRCVIVIEWEEEEEEEEEAHGVGVSNWATNREANRKELTEKK